jgi:hypothetical protein
MDDKGRERVAAFLDSIGLPLDVREKGKRDRQQKWFSSSGFDAFVLGNTSARSTPKGPSPLALPACGNISLWEVIHCVYHRSIEDAEAARLQSQAAELQKRAAASEAAAAAAAAASRAAVQKRPKQSGRNTCRTVPTSEPKRRKRKEEKGAHVGYINRDFMTVH